MLHAYSASIQEVEAEGSDKQPWLHSTSKASLSYTGPYLQSKTNKPPPPTARGFFRTREHRYHPTTCGTTPNLLYVNGPTWGTNSKAEHISVAVTLFPGCIQFECVSSLGSTLPQHLWCTRCYSRLWTTAGGSHGSTGHCASERKNHWRLRWQGADLGLETSRPRQWLSPCQHLTLLTCCHVGLSASKELYDHFTRMHCNNQKRAHIDCAPDTTSHP